MPFTFPLPDPDSLVVTPAIGPDGEPTVVASAEIMGAITQAIQDQEDSLLQIVGKILDGLNVQIQAQEAALATVWQPILAQINQQIAGQRASLEIVMTRIRNDIEQRIAQIGEEVTTVATHAALQQPQPSPMPQTAPGPPPRLPPPPPFGRPRGPAPFSPPTTQPAPVLPQVPHIPPSGVGPAEPYTPGAPVQPGGETGTGGSAPGTIRFGPVGGTGDAVPHEGSAGLPGGITGGTTPVLAPPVPPVDEGGAGPPVQLPPDGGAQPQGGHGGGGPVQSGMGGAGQPTIIVEPSPAPNVLVTVNVDSKAAAVNVEQSQQILVSPEDEERDRRRKLGPAAEVGEDFFAKEAPPRAGECPWKIGQKLPAIGGPEWCRLQQGITQALADLGNAIIDVLLAPISLALDMPPEGKVAQILGRANPMTPLVGAILWVLEQIGLKKVIDGLRDLLTCWRQVAQMAPECHPAAFLGLCVVRSVVRLMRNFRVGSDTFVWATIDIAIDLVQIDRAVSYILEAVCPSIIPSADDAWHAYRAGYVDEQTMRCWNLAAGIDADLWLAVRQSKGHTASTEQVILWARLSGQGDQGAETGLIERGWSRDTDRRLVIALYDAPPSADQIMQWIDVGVYDDVVTRLLDRDHGSEDVWGDERGALLRAHGVTHEVFLSRYRAQQPLPTLSALQEYAYRLREGNAANVPPVTLDNVRAVLSASDMPQRQVDWAMATFYRPLSVGDVSLLSRTGGDTAQLWEGAYLDAGYQADHARRLANASRWESARAYYASVGGPTIGMVATAIRAGLTLPADWPAALAEQGWTQGQWEAAALSQAIAETARLAQRGRQRARQQAVNATLGAYRIGVISADGAAQAIASAGYDAGSAKAIVTASDLVQQSQRAQRGVSLLSRAYLAGEVTDAQASTILDRIGIQHDRATQLLAAWRIERQAQRPMAHVGEIRKWVAQGLMPMPMARQRLLNLGWHDPDLTLLLSELGAQLAKAQAKTRKAGASAALAAVKSAETVRTKAMRKLERERPVAALGRWYKEGVIGRQEVHDRMKAIDFDAQSIKYYLEGWDKELAGRKKSTTAHPHGTTLTPQRQQPLSALRKWLLDGIVDEAYVRERMASYGYEQDAIDGYVTEWNQQLAYRQAKAKPPAPV